MLDARSRMTTHCLASIERFAPILGRKDLEWLEKEESRNDDVKALWTNFENEMLMVVAERNSAQLHPYRRGPIGDRRCLSIRSARELLRQNARA